MRSECKYLVQSQFAIDLEVEDGVSAVHLASYQTSQVEYDSIVHWSFVIARFFPPCVSRFIVFCSAIFSGKAYWTMLQVYELVCGGILIGTVTYARAWTRT